VRKFGAAVSRHLRQPEKTCRKLGFSFWDYLADRIESREAFPRLSLIIRQRACAVSALP